MKKTFNSHKETINEKLLPSVSIDYLTLKFDAKGRSLVDCAKEFDAFELQLKALRPDFVIKSKSSGPFVNEETDSSNSNPENALEKLRDIRLPFDGFYQIVDQSKFRGVVVMFPGPVSEKIIYWIMSGEIVLAPTVEITRLDLKVNLLEFAFTCFDKDLKLLEDFHQLQDGFMETNYPQRIRPQSKQERPVKLVKTSNFCAVYVNRRRSSILIRTYIAEFLRNSTLRKKVFEIEVKGESAKCFTEFVLNGDFYGFNKLVVLTFLLAFEQLVECPFTEPLYQWKRDILDKLKNHYFSNEVHPLKKAKVNSIVPTNLHKKSYVFNPKLINLIGYDNKKATRQVLILLFCTHRLLMAWKNHFTLDEVTKKLNGLKWDSSFFQKQTFREGNDFKVEFPLRDLVISLGLTYNPYSCNCVIELLKELLDKKKLDFEINGVYFHEHLVFSFEVDKTKGKLIIVRLILHPFVIHDLAQNVFFSGSILTKFNNLFLKDVEGNKEFPDTQATCFVRFMHSFLTQDELPVKTEIMSKEIKDGLRLEGKAKVTYKVLQLIQNETQIYLGVSFDNDGHIEQYYKIPLEIWNGLFKKKEKQYSLKKAKFFFNDKKELRNATNENQKYHLISS